jgi:hypothetical protein
VAGEDDRPGARRWRLAPGVRTLEDELAEADRGENGDRTSVRNSDHRRKDRVRRTVHPVTRRIETVLDANKSAVTAGGYVTELVYELLDAHVDTMRLAHDLDGDPAWAAHLDYLRDLQRVGREALAHAPDVTT